MPSPTRASAASNDIVIAHELLHTVGASDKYDLASGMPLFPIGSATATRQPLLSAAAHRDHGRAPRRCPPGEWDTPRSLREVVVGPETALEIRWSKP